MIGSNKDDPGKFYMDNNNYLSSKISNENCSFVNADQQKISILELVKKKYNQCRFINITNIIT